MALKSRTVVGTATAVAASEVPLLQGFVFVSKPKLAKIGNIFSLFTMYEASK